MKKLIILNGDKYGRMTIIAETSSPTRHRRVIARCECGSIKEVWFNDLRSKKTTSCGCYQKERVRETSTTHGISNTVEYRVWWDMVARCTDINHKAYSDYGGRGIVVCDEWLSDPCAFLSHVGLRPSWAECIDRVDNDYGYFPGNVRWTTMLKNSKNTRRSKFWIIDGKTYNSIKEAAHDLNISVSSVKQWCKGWKCYRTGKFYLPKSGCSYVSKY